MSPEVPEDESRAFLHKVLSPLYDMDLHAQATFGSLFLLRAMKIEFYTGTTQLYTNQGKNCPLPKETGKMTTECSVVPGLDPGTERQAAWVRVPDLPLTAV